MAVLSQKGGGPGLFAARGVDLGQLSRATGNGIQDSEMQPSAAVSQCFSFRMESDQSERRSREPGPFPELSVTSVILSVFISKMDIYLILWVSRDCCED